MLKTYLKALRDNPLIKKYQAYILLATTTILSVSLFIFLIIPQGLKLYEASKKTKDTEDKTEFLKHKLELLKQVDLQKYKSDYQTSLTSLPEDKDYSGAINQVITLIKANNLKLAGMSLATQGAPIDGAQSYTIKIDISGTTISIKNFVASLKTAPRLVRVNSIEISNGKNNDSTTGSINLLVFYQEAQTIIGQLDSPLILPNEKEFKNIESIKKSVSQTPITQTPGIIDIPKGKSNPFQ